MKRLLYLGIGFAIVFFSIRFYDHNRSRVIGIRYQEPGVSYINPPPIQDVEVTRLPPQYKHEYVEFAVAAGYYLLMLLGMITATAYDALDKENPNKKVNFRRILARISTPGTYQGMLVSPIVFGMLRASLTTDDLTLTMALFAFQNGFFWRSTFTRLRPSSGAAATPTPVPTPAPET
jgi:hypothetical protein